MVELQLIQELSYLGLTELEMRKEISPFLDHIQFFVKKYLNGHQVYTVEKRDRGSNIIFPTILRLLGRMSS